MSGDEDDLTPPEGWETEIEGAPPLLPKQKAAQRPATTDPPAQQKTQSAPGTARPAPAPAPAGAKPSGPPVVARRQERTEYRGLGNGAWETSPVACVVEVMKREPDPDNVGKWRPVRPFAKGTSPDAKWSFVIMTAAPCSTGPESKPIRQPHPSFAAFNTCPPQYADKLPMLIVHEKPSQCWHYSRTMYADPSGKKLPNGAYFCRGDGKTASRADSSGACKTITCPDEMCEYRQEGLRVKCTPHLTLLGQFRWPANWKLPPWSFEWHSQSNHNYASIQGLLRLVNDTSFALWRRGLVSLDIDEALRTNEACPDGLVPVPLFGLPIDLTVFEMVKAGTSQGAGRRFPVVKATMAAALHTWIMEAASRLRGGHRPMDGPKPLNELPPPGATIEQIEEATQLALNPEYLPANERKGSAT